MIKLKFLFKVLNLLSLLTLIMKMAWFYMIFHSLNPIAPAWIIKIIRKWKKKITNNWCWWIKWINNIKRWINNNTNSIQCRWIIWECSSNKLVINNRIMVTMDTWIIKINRRIKCNQPWPWTILLNIHNTHLSNSTMAIHLLTWCNTWIPIHNNLLKSQVEIKWTTKWTHNKW